MDVAERAVEKTGAQCRGGLDDRRYPRRVATRRNRRQLPKVRPKVKHDAPQFLRGFHHETHGDVIPVFTNQRFNFLFEPAYLLSVQSNTVLAFPCPASGAIERLGSDVSGEK